MNADGSFSPSLERADQVFEYVTNAAIAVGCNVADDFHIVLDVGASHFYDEVTSFRNQFRCILS